MIEDSEESRRAAEQFKAYAKKLSIPEPGQKISDALAKPTATTKKEERYV